MSSRCCHLGVLLESVVGAIVVMLGIKLDDGNASDLLANNRLR
jgi:hypothetical protein